MLKVINAYENNLKNISLDIPLNKIVSIIGVSGSGKSTLIYNVIANEAKRREKIDSGNATCLDFAIRAKFDEIKNLPYAITLKQRGISGTITSTIATYTGLHELLRDEFYQEGKIYNELGNEVKEPTIDDIKKFIEKNYKNVNYELFTIICLKNYSSCENELNKLKKYNVKEVIYKSCRMKEFVKKELKSLKKLNQNFQHTILVPILINEMDKYQNIAKSFILKIKDKEINFYHDYPDLETNKLYQKISSEPI